MGMRGRLAREPEPWPNFADQIHQAPQIAAGTMKIQARRQRSSRRRTDAPTPTAKQSPMDREASDRSSRAAPAASRTEDGSSRARNAPSPAAVAKTMLSCAPGQSIASHAVPRKATTRVPARATGWTDAATGEAEEEGVDRDNGQNADRSEDAVVGPEEACDRVKEQA